MNTQESDPADLLVAILNRSHPALVLDVDGTLSDIVEDPGSAQVRPAIRDAIRRLTQRLDLVAIVSGRSVLEARRLVRVPEAVYFGNHGAERLARGKVMIAEGGKRLASVLALLLPRLRQKLQPLGVVVEDKGIALSLHYRTAPDPRAAHTAILNALRDTGVPRGLHLHAGKKVIELRPDIGNKGFVVKRLQKEYQLDGIVYIGDDTTDLDAFRALRELGPDVRSAAVAVESPESPEELKEADFSVAGVDGVEELLTYLAAVMPERSTVRPPRRAPAGPETAAPSRSRYRSPSPAAARRPRDGRAPRRP